ncbi:hypothetical protein AOC36_09090 [Erysipelothrix larvae]|uniref:ASCH domain-containing protein n=1 Tax=Erysipelothrix larvae TaxID=1514105 RepID=A0A0X8H122_9FIRM|nr:ASCH domain-containing protein [Erysipelothrix larvae]AMC94137.1 hypothetical protein AOC36_09090 [Erysipelothrix larvae]
MIIKMNLENDAYDMIRLGMKDVEMRINDEKRQLIEVGDTIIFTNLTTRERFNATVTALTPFKSFKELFEAYEPTRLGYKKDEISDYRDMYHYYAQEAIETYGALAIEIQCVKEQS